MYLKKTMKPTDKALYRRVVVEQCDDAKGLCVC